jgi:hypothetical protein
MKRKLLYLTAMTLFSTFSSITAQTVWDLGGNSAPWTATATATTTNVVLDNLGLYPGSATTFAIIETSAVTFSAPDAYTSVNRFKLNGGGNPDSNKPTQRYVYFAAAGSVSVKIWFRTGGSGTRTLYVTDGTNVLGSLGSSSSTENLVLTTPATIVNGNVYIYGDQSINIYKIEVTGAVGTTSPIPVLSTDDFQADASSNVFSNGKLVFVSDVKSDTKVDVYGISGILVKSLTTSSDTSFDLNTGIYIVRSKSAEGVKSAKVLIN